MAITISLPTSTVIALTLTLVTTTIISHKSPFYPSHRSLLSTTTTITHCHSIKTYTNTNTTNNTIIDSTNTYLSLHFCLFNQNPHLSLPFLSLLLLLYFYTLSTTAQIHFSTVTTKLSSLLRLSPSMAGVTLLALGNGAPDVFSSLSALSSGHYRTGFGAILSAGAFVSAFVVGFVAIKAAPFSLDPAPFIRDVMFYMIAASFLFYVYLSGEIFVWQAVGFVGFYVFFVGFVFWMDLRIQRERGKRERLGDLEAESDSKISGAVVVVGVEGEKGKEVFGFRSVYEKVNVFFRLFYGF